MCVKAELRYTILSMKRNISSLNQSCQKLYFLPNNANKLIFRIFFFSLTCELQNNIAQNDHICPKPFSFMAKGIYNPTVLFKYQQKLYTLTFTNTQVDINNCFL